MKILKITLIIALISCFNYSCSSDDDSPTGETGDVGLANEQNALEDNAVALATLESGIEIEGASKNSGTPPQPNSNLNLAVASNSVQAVQSSGFNLKFSSTETAIAGAYLQFTDTDNNATASYFDIPVSSFEQSKKAKVKSSSKGVFSKSSSLTDNQYEIDIDFDNSFPPGKFCGVLCLYDSENNISQPITVCVEVEAWGGNASIVGNWIEISSTDVDGGTQINCSNGQTKTVPYEQYLKQELTLIIENDGDFKVTDDEEYKSIDYTASQNNCEAVYHNEIEKYNAEEIGKWAYNESDNTLTLVSFKYIDFLEPQYSEEYPNGELIVEGALVEIKNGNLIITETYIDGNETYTDVYTFERF